MNAASHVAVRVTRRFSAAPERVFDAWLDPETIRREARNEADLLLGHAEA